MSSNPDHPRPRRPSREFACGSRRLSGLRMQMPRSRPHLHALAPTLITPQPVPDGARCRTPGCRLPASGRSGLCGSCQDVYRAAVALCDRLVDREIARLEHQTPGIVDAIYRDLARAGLVTPRPCCPHPAVPGPGVVLIPSWRDLERVDALAGELHLARVSEAAR
jgi:hypothetical protein